MTHVNNKGCEKESVARPKQSSKSVDQINLDTMEIIATFESQADTKAAGFKPGKVGKCCNGHNRSHQGFGWQYADGTSPPFELKIERPIVRVNITTGQIDKTYADLRKVKQDGFTPYAVSECAQGKRSKHKGFRWYYKGEEKLRSEEVIDCNYNQETFTKKEFTKHLSLDFCLRYMQNADIAIGENSVFYIKPLDVESVADKTKLYLLAKGIRCLFFQDEWINKHNIAHSMVSHRLNLSTNKIFARKCVVQSVTPRVGNDFFIDNHISGGTQASYAFGLFNDSRLVACLSFRRPFIKKYSGAIEIARFASALNTSIPGGLPKLLAVAEPYLKAVGYDSILTYADKRFGDGNSYVKSGFAQIGTTDLDYFYTDSIQRFNRFKFKANRGISEKEIASMAGVHKVYGAGSYIFKKDLL